MTMVKNLTAQRAKAQREFEAARTEAEQIANSETDALSSDDAYIGWTRRKKLAEREVARLEAALATIADEIEAETGRQQRDALHRRYVEVRERNAALQERLATFQSDMLPALLKLLRDLAQDELDVTEVNRLVPGVQYLEPADHALRSIPSVQATETSTFSPAQDLPPIWKTIVLPRPGRRGTPTLYNGEHAYSPHRAVQLLEQALQS